MAGHRSRMFPHRAKNEVGILPIAPFQRGDLSLAAMGLYARILLLPEDELRHLSADSHPQLMEELRAAGLAERRDGDWYVSW